MGLHIRRYKASDKDAVFALHKTSLEAVGILSDYRQGWDNDFNDIEGVYLKNGDFLVGEIDNKIVAMGAIRKVSEGACELKRMRIAPGFQRKGYGKIMLEALEARARELGYSKMVLDTTTRLPGAQPFYIKNGYHVTGRKIVDFNGHDVEIVYFEKDLVRLSANSF